MATELEILTASFDADVTRFTKKMDQLGVKFDKTAGDIERRNRQLADKMNAGWKAINATGNFFGIDKVKAAITGLTAAGIIGGLGDLAKKSLEAASSIADTATAAGVSVETLQKLRYAASQSGASFDLLDTGLTALNKNFGDFINTGAGRAATAFKQLGIDKLINAGDVRNTEQAFDAIVAKLKGVGSEAQKAALVSRLFGQESGPRLLQLLEQGTGGIAELEKKAQDLGLVLSGDVISGAREANDKLNTLFQIIKAEGVAAFASLAPQIAELAQEITNSLPDLVTYVEKWADFFGLINLSPTQKLRVEIADLQADITKLQAQKADNPWWKKIFGLSDSEFDTLIAADKAKLAKATKELNGGAIADTELSLFQNNKAPAPPPPALHVAQTDAERALQARQKEALAKSVLDAKTAAAALTAAQDATQVQMLKGSDGYYAAVQKQIEDEYTNRVGVINAEAGKQLAALDKVKMGWKDYGTAVANINAATDAQIAAADEERKQKQFESGPAGLIQQAKIAAEQIRTSYADEASQYGLTAGAAAKLAYVQQQINMATERGTPITQAYIETLNHEGDQISVAAQAAHDHMAALQDNIEVSDDLRNSLEDVGAASLKGFGNMKQAASDALAELAQLIFKLGVMKPLVEDLLGQGGTSNGGIGSLLGGGKGGGGGFINSILNMFGSGDLAMNTSAAIAANPLIFADGGIYQKGKGSLPLKRFATGGISSSAAIFGETGRPEAAVPLPDGRSIPVALRMPSTPQASQPTQVQQTTIVQQFDLTGALVSQDIFDEIDKRANSQAQKVVGQYDKNYLPKRVEILNRYPRRAH